MNPLDQIMGVEEAAELWGLNPGYIKNLCNRGEIKAKKIGKTWVIDKHQPNPGKRRRAKSRSSDIVINKEEE